MKRLAILLPLALSLQLCLGVVLAAAAATPDRDRQWSERLEQRIDDAPGTTAEQRSRMRQNLGACLGLPLSDDDVAALFPGDGPDRMGPDALLECQSRVLALAGDGLPADVVAAKIREGRMKMARELPLLATVARLENCVRAAGTAVASARAGGVAGDDAQSRDAVRTMARDMWRGMDAGDFEALTTRARERAREGGCDVGALASASSMCADLRDAGAEPGRALRIACDALAAGYDEAALHRMRAAVAAGGPDHDPSRFRNMLSVMENSLGEGQGVTEMCRHLVQAGWMGPADLGSGGGGAIDHQGGSHGGMNDGGGGMGGGSGGDDHHGGGMQ